MPKPCQLRLSLTLCPRTGLYPQLLIPLPRRPSGRSLLQIPCRRPLQAQTATHCLVSSHFLLQMYEVFLEETRSLQIVLQCRLLLELEFCSSNCFVGTQKLSKSANMLLTFPRLSEAERQGCPTDISSEFSIDSPLYHEPSLSANMGKVDDSGDSEAGSKQEGGWARGYFDPFGVLGKVFGRRSSAGSAQEAPGRGEGQVRGNKAVQALDFGQAIDSPPM